MPSRTRPSTVKYRCFFGFWVDPESIDIGGEWPHTTSCPLKHASAVKIRCFFRYLVDQESMDIGGEWIDQTS